MENWKNILGLIHWQRNQNSRHFAQGILLGMQYCLVKNKRVLRSVFVYQRSKASNSIKYCVALENQDLGIVKQKLKKGTVELIIAPPF
ncbi:MAG: hypothetical protein AAF757_00165 [Cyanobacteria bacterium P01_D01_bin.116]